MDIGVSFEGLEKGSQGSKGWDIQPIYAVGLIHFHKGDALLLLETKFQRKEKGERGDSNPQPLDPQSSALPVELRSP